MEKQKGIEKDFLWVLSVIRSCEHPAQLEMTTLLIDLLYKRISHLEVKVLQTKQELKQRSDEMHKDIDELFHTKAIQVNYYQYKETKSRES